MDQHNDASIIVFHLLFELAIIMFGLSLEDERIFHERLAWGVIWTSLPCFVVLLWIIPSPWGKTATVPRQQPQTGNKEQQPHTATKYLGPLLPAKIAWMVFESPNLIFAYWCWKERPRDSMITDSTTTLGGLPVNQVLFAIFVVHYIRRAIVYPLQLGKSTKGLPLAVVLSGLVYCSINGYLQSQSLCLLDAERLNTQTSTVRLTSGLLVMACGAAMNIHSDRYLQSLKTSSAPHSSSSSSPPSSSSYKIPYGGFFTWVSTPHYFGEILLWFGYAFVTGFALAPLSFWIFTVSNLVPRGVSHHVWYQETFGKSYPPNRKAIIPFIW